MQLANIEPISWDGKETKGNLVKKVRGEKKKSEIIQVTHEGHGEKHSCPSIKKNSA